MHSLKVACGVIFVAVALLCESSLGYQSALFSLPTTRSLPVGGEGRRARSQQIKIRQQLKRRPLKAARPQLASSVSSWASPPPLWLLASSELCSVSFSFLGGVSNRGEEDDTEEEEDEVILSYLPDSGRNLPPQIKALVVRVTKNYIYGRTSEVVATTTTLQEIAALVEEEHRSRDVPVIVGDVVADVTVTGEELDEICAEILSLAALYRLPKEITLELLKAPAHKAFGSSISSSSSSSSLLGDSSLIECQVAFAASGWDAVSFPLGLAIRPKTKFRFNTCTTVVSNDGNNSGRRSPMSWLHRAKTLRTASADAVAAAALVQPPARRLLDRREFLKSMDAQLLLSETEDAPSPPSAQAAATASA